MLCQKCGKNEADVHFIQTVNGEKTEMLICSQCAAGNGLAFSPISFANFFQGFLDSSEAVNSPKMEENIKCPNCGMSLKKVKKTGKAGCAQCYDVFKAQMQTIIKNVQAGDAHTGKLPKNAKGLLEKREIGQLRRKLAEAVEKEEYEEAARIRDMIRAYEGGKDNGKMV